MNFALSMAAGLLALVALMGGIIKRLCQRRNWPNNLERGGLRILELASSRL